MGEYTVYLHINPYNNKKYVGITSTNVKQRWWSGYHENTKFYKDIQKYGWKNFIHLILYEGLSKERAEFVETRLIYLFDSVENGYNRSYGNNGSGGRKVICTTTNKIFNTETEAEKFYGIKCRHIGDCCRGKRKSCGKLADGTKLQWEFLKDYGE